MASAAAEQTRDESGGEGHPVTYKELDIKSAVTWARETQGTEMSEDRESKWLILTKNQPPGGLWSWRQGNATSAHTSR